MINTDFDFTSVIDRRNTGSYKYDLFQPDVLPVWIADMDFRSPPCILDALHKSIEHGTFGYSKPRRELVDLILERLSVRHNWTPTSESILFMPGIVSALNLATRLLPDDAEVLIPTPAYPPFLSCAPNQNRKTVRVPMKCDETQWRLDFDALQKAVTANTAMLVLCNPHNPTGRVFTTEELSCIADFVEKNDLLLVSDEIHCDIVLKPGAEHISIAAAQRRIAQSTITLLSASKTFNTAGLGCAFAVIENDELRQRFAPSGDGLVPHINQLGYIATEAAYRDGEPWRQGLIKQLQKNCQRVEETVNSLERISMIAPEATYLAWIDCSALGLDDPSALFLEHKLAVGFGSFFGDEQYIRINFACPPATLEEALKRLTEAVLSVTA